MTPRQTHYLRRPIRQYLDGVREKKSILALLFCFLMLLAYMGDSIAQHYGISPVEVEGNYYNRLINILVVILAVPSLLHIVIYYTRAFGWYDLILLVFLVLYIPGYRRQEEVSLFSFTNLLRLITWFYIVPYFLHHAKTLIDHTYLVVILIGLFEIWSILNVGSFARGGERIALSGTATATARALLVPFVICYAVYHNKTLFGRTLRLLAFGEGVILAFLILLTGSRQAVVGLLIIIPGSWLLTSRNYQRISIQSLRRWYLYIFGALLFALLVWMGLGMPDVLSGRVLDLSEYSLEANQGRTLQWVYYGKYILENWSTLIFNGFDSALVHRGNMRIDNIMLTAPHNIVLAVVVQSGLLATLFYLLWHIILVRTMLRIHQLLNSPALSALAIATAFAAIFVGMVDNYFLEVSSPLSYLLYTIVGFYCNLDRVRRRERLTLVYRETHVLSESLLSKNLAPKKS